MRRRSELLISECLLELAQPFSFGKQTEQFSSLAVLKHKENLFFVLEGRVDLDQKRMIDLCQDLTLHHDPFHLVLLLDVFFLH